MLVSLLVSHLVSNVSFVLVCIFEGKVLMLSLIGLEALHVCPHVSDANVRSKGKKYG